jgi:hypothetical protein
MENDLDRQLNLIVLGVRFHEVVEDLRDLLHHERNGPGEQVHEIRKKIRMGALHELLDV